MAERRKGTKAQRHNGTFIVTWLQNCSFELMKRLIYIIATAILLISCEKSSELLIPDSQVPKWLKERISDDEKKIESDPKSGLVFAAWFRYEYEGSFYFEYVNIISSAGPKTFKYDGTEFIYTTNGFTEYQSGKCCKRYVWKGPEYFL